MKKFLVAVVLLNGILLLRPAWEGRPAEASRRTHTSGGFGKRIAGTYLYTLSLGDDVQLVGLATFGREGTVVTTDSGDSLFLGTTQSPGHAAWAQVGHQEIALTQFELDYDEAGVLTSFFKASGDLSFDTTFSEFMGQFVVEVFSADQDPLDPDAEPVIALDAIVEGRRIRAQ